MPKEGRNPEKSGKERRYGGRWGWTMRTVRALQQETRIPGQRWGFIQRLSQHHKSGKNLRAVQTKISQMTVKGKDKPVYVAL